MEQKTPVRGSRWCGRTSQRLCTRQSAKLRQGGSSHVLDVSVESEDEREGGLQGDIARQDAHCATSALSLSLSLSVDS